MDNEYGSHVAEVPAFQAGKYLVSNQEFLAFVQANGYGIEGFWRRRVAPGDVIRVRNILRSGSGKAPSGGYG